MAPAVEVRGVEKRYGALRALAGISLDVQPGEFFGLLGPNGAGNHALEIGVNEYMGKPYQEDQLLALIRRYTQEAAFA